MPEAVGTIFEHYATSPYAAFDQEWREGGSFGVQMLHAEQDAHELTDPALPTLIIVGVKNASIHAEFDFGDGWKRHSVFGRKVDLQPANQECRFRIDGKHSVLVASLDIGSVTRTLDEAGIHADPFVSLYAAMAGGPEALTLLEMMWEAMADGGPANDLLVDGCAIALLGRFSALAGQGGAWQVPALDDQRLNRVVDYIETCFEKPVRMEDLAAVACLSLVHFSRSFKAATGQTPHGYLTGRRVAHAKRLLAETHLGVLQVGYLCGFNSPAHFAATFRARIGVSPSSYRATLLNQ